MMTLPLDAIFVCALAAWRLSYMLAYETGPGAIFETLRFYAGASTPNCSQQRADDRITNVLCCLNCLSVWVAALIVAIWLFVPLVVYVLALSALAIFVQRIMAWAT